MLDSVDAREGDLIWDDLLSQITKPDFVICKNNIDYGHLLFITEHSLCTCLAWPVQVIWLFCRK